MKERQQQLRFFLQGTLHELNKLSEQIRTTRDYSEQAELILCLHELVAEQIEAGPSENPSHTAHTIR